MSRILIAGLRLVALASLCSACGGPSKESGAEDVSSLGGASGKELEEAVSVTSPPLSLEKTARYFRLELSDGPEGIELLSISLEEQAHLPPPSFAPTLMAVGYEQDQVVTVAPFAFSYVARATSFEEGAHQHTESIIESPTVTVFLEAKDDIDSVKVLSPDEGEELSLDGDELPTELGERFPQARRFGSKSQSISDEQLAFRYSHIRFLGQGDDAIVSKGLLGKANLIDPSEDMNDVIANGLAHVAPGLLGSVSHIAVVKWPTGEAHASETLGIALGSQLILNADLFGDRDVMSATIVHEIAHNFTFLCNSAAGEEPDFTPDDWPSAVANAASSLIGKHQLVAGLSDAFKTLHQSGIPLDLTAAYTGDQWQALSLSGAHSKGFASPYGSTNEWEDFAEYVGTTQLPTASCPGICPFFAGVSTIGQVNAIPYAKLVFLRSIGAIGSTEFEACVGGVGIDYQEGIHFDQISFTSELKAGYLPMDDGSQGFGVIGASPSSYQILFEYPLRHEKASPLGLYRFDDIWAFNFAWSGSSPGAYLAHDEPLRARLSQSGMILLTEATPDRVRGLILGLVLQNAAGSATDYMPFGTFQIH